MSPDSRTRYGFAGVRRVHLRRPIPFALGTAAVLSVSTVALAGHSNAASPGSCGPRGKPPPATIGAIQGLQFKLMEKSSFNYFNRPRVVRDLLHNRRLWCGALMDRDGKDFLIKLRDIEDNAWNVDTLYILSSGNNDKTLRRLASHWNADDITWVSGAQAETLLGEMGTGHRRILEVWWD
jgi:hypothetical protein